MMQVVLLLAVTTLVSAWLTRRFASPGAKFRIVDTPNARSLHATATPRTGGVAILGAFGVGLVLTVAAARVGRAGDVLAAAAAGFASRDVLAIVAATLFVGAISLWNDRHEVSPALRLAAQFAAAAGLIWTGDFTITGLSVPFAGTVPLGWPAYPLTLLFLVWMTNLYNFMDGMDGFAGGMALIGFGVLGWLALFLGSADLGMLALIVAAASAGFLVYNFPPARIFMGDAGAAPLGFLAAALAVMANRERVFGLWVPVIVFSPFIVDATVVLIRRAMRGARVWEAHREHYYQRLVLAGWSHRKTVAVEYLVMLGWGIVAVVYKRRGEVGHVVVLALGVVVYTLLAVGVRAVERRAGKVERPAGTWTNRRRRGA